MEGLAYGVADGPGDEVHGDGEGFLGLAGDVSWVVLVAWGCFVWRLGCAGWFCLPGQETHA